MDFRTLDDALHIGLVRHTHWLPDSDANRKVLLTAYTQVIINPGRSAIYVRHRDTTIALFVNKQLRPADTDGPRSRSISKSGKYRSIRHLAECLFAEKSDLDLKSFKKAMKEEYPKSPSGGISCYNHFSYYRHKLVKQGLFQCIPVPEWYKQGN